MNRSKKTYSFKGKVVTHKFSKTGDFILSIFAIIFFIIFCILVISAFIGMFL